MRAFPERSPAADMRSFAMVVITWGSAAAVMNASNEVAVDAFLSGKIGFLGITELTRAVLDNAEGSGMLGAMTSLEDVSEAD